MPLKALWLASLLVAPMLATPAGAEPAAAADLAPDVITPPHLTVRDLGRAPAGTRISLAVTLRYRNQGELDALTLAQADPASPLYHRFLTAAQFRARYAPAPADEERALALLTRAGFRIDHAFPNRTVIDASAPASVVERYFATEIHRVAQPGVHGPHYANARTAVIPAELRSTVYSVVGFDNLRAAQPDFARGVARSDAAGLMPPVFGPDLGLTPYTIATAYDFPVQHKLNKQRTYDGRGTGVAIAMDSDYLDSDFETYLAYLATPLDGPAPTRVPVDGGAQITVDSYPLTLELETVQGLAPGTALYVYEMPQLATSNIVDTYNQEVSDDLVDVSQSGFGGCEQLLPSGFPQTVNRIAEQGAAEGIAFNASSGDLGAACDTNGDFQPISPASSPYFTAVGGTSLVIHSDGTYWHEFGWPSSGGGISAIFATPKWQRGVKNIIDTGRNVPDVAFDGDQGSGLTFYYIYKWQGPLAGTTASSAIFSALVAEVDQMQKSRSGAITPTIYTVWRANGYGEAFRDIVDGNNGAYSATRGYDRVTGIGSMLGYPYGLASGEGK